MILSVYNIKREPGFYWVKWANGKWEICEWIDERGFQTTGDWQFYSEPHIIEIDERRIDRHVYTLGMKHYDEDGKEIK